jgi:hypothetical protein
LVKRRSAGETPVSQTKPIAPDESRQKSSQPAADAKGLELRMELDPEVGPVMGDADRLQQILWNLLTNAIKYTPRSGRLDVTLKKEETSAVIVVRDTGEGISPDFLPHIFVRFRQADITTTRKHGGLGLGLAIVRHLVEAHGGQVSAMSEGAGQGAAFRIVLPLMKFSASDLRVENKDAAEQSSSLTGLQVLLVEDNPDARGFLGLALKKRGAKVKTAPRSVTRSRYSSNGTRMYC